MKHRLNDVVTPSPNPPVLRKGGSTARSAVALNE